MDKRGVWVRARSEGVGMGEDSRMALLRLVLWKGCVEGSIQPAEAAEVDEWVCELRRKATDFDTLASIVVELDAILPEEG